MRRGELSRVVASAPRLRLEVALVAKLLLVAMTIPGRAASQPRPGAGVPPSSASPSSEAPVFVDEGRVVVTRERPPDAEAEAESTGLLLADRAFWRKGEDRFFAAGSLEAGAIFAAPRFSLGYGRPHWAWAGFELRPQISGSAIGSYAGVRAGLREITLRVGARYVFTFDRSFLEPRESYDHLNITARSGPASRYFSGEAELQTILRVGSGTVRGWLTAMSLHSIDAQFYVFEEALNVVVDPPWVWRARAGYQINLGPGAVGRIIPMVEVVGVPDRDTEVLRVGYRGRLLLWDQFEIFSSMMIPIASRDNLGLDGGEAFRFGIRYRFATFN